MIPANRYSHRPFVGRGVAQPRKVKREQREDIFAAS